MKTGKDVDCFKFDFYLGAVVKRRKDYRCAELQAKTQPITIFVLLNTKSASLTFFHCSELQRLSRHGVSQQTPGRLLLTLLTFSRNRC